MAEKDWYPKIMKFLEEEGYICHSFLKTSKKKFKRFDFIDTGIGSARIDVFGVKRTSARSSNFQLETVGIEVKDIDYITIRNMRQAASYSHLCTRCYLAVPIKEYSETEKKNAAELGIGLIRLKNPFKVIVESRKFNTDIDLANQLLKQLNVVFCTTCRTYKYRYDPKNPEYNGGSWRSDVFSDESKWTYICNQCSIRFSKNARAYLEERDVDWLWNDISKLKRQNNQRRKDVDRIWDEMERIKKRMKREREIDDTRWSLEIERAENKIERVKNKIE